MRRIEFDEALGSVNMPQSIEFMGSNVFKGCKVKVAAPKVTLLSASHSLKAHSPISTAPSITTLCMGSNVFKGCKVKVAAPKKTGDVGFEIADNVLIKYKGKSKDAVIPDIAVTLPSAGIILSSNP